MACERVPRNTVDTYCDSIDRRLSDTEKVESCHTITVSHMRLLVGMQAVLALALSLLKEEWPECRYLFWHGATHLLSASHLHTIVNVSSKIGNPGSFTCFEKQNFKVCKV